MTEQQAATERYVVCITEDGGMDLVARKVYRVLPDESAARDDWIRVIDESGDDYLYPAAFFAAIDVPEDSLRALRCAPDNRRQATN